MSVNNAAKRSRASPEQLTQMVDYMTQNPGFCGGQFQKLHGKYENEKKWRELADLLNGIGGAVKTVEQWQTVWRDLKSRTSVKVRDRKKQMALTGNNPILEESISELEKRVVSLVGKSYIEGHEEVKENIPSEEALQLRMEEGEDIVYDIPSSPNKSESYYEFKYETPTTSNKKPRRRTPKKVSENEVQNKFLDIANKQAECLKLLAECAAANVENVKMMAEATKTLGTGMSAVAEAFNNLAISINNLQ
ncbi:uncharacterized protein LOC142234765 [Haematobia irritans]|uniref:uncharacterized protein LOC142234765 n=1 Tax=Haematobia irritans TaxID=7368 RepID=UPI003F50BBA1